MVETVSSAEFGIAVTRKFCASAEDHRYRLNQTRGAVRGGRRKWKRLPRPARARQPLVTGRLHPLENARCAHAGADTHGHHAVLQLAPAQGVDHRGRADRAGGPEQSVLQFVQQFRVPIEKPKQICHRR